MPKLSIIVPVYNVEQYLDKCVNSILNQTFSDFELILVDDGSPDNCGGVCDNFALQDERVIVIHKENGGLSSARNVGIDAARGEYIGFIDSDDWIDQDMYELLYSIAVKYNADIVECSYRNITSDGIVEETENTGEIVEADNIFALDAQLEWKYFKSVAVNKIYHKNVFADGKRYPVGKTHEDEYFTHEVFYSAQKLVYIDQSKYNYLRLRSDSITGKAFNKTGMDACEAFSKRVDFFKEKRLEKLIRKAENMRDWVIRDRFNLVFNELVYSDKLSKERKYELQQLLKYFFQEYFSTLHKAVGRKTLLQAYMLIYSFRLYKILRYIVNR